MFIQTKKFSVDENIIPYNGRHDNKHFIRGKPICFGFKGTLMQI